MRREFPNVGTATLSKWGFGRRGYRTMNVLQRLRPGHGSSPECGRVARVLQAYLDEELDAERADVVRRHLAQCRDCGLDAATYRRLIRSLRRQAPPDPDVLDRLRAFTLELAHDAEAR